jgi:zinc transporter ZupT
MNAILLSLAAFVSTSVGGLVALGLRDRLHLVLGFGAGVVLGVVLFELLPELLELSHRLGSNGQPAMLALVAGFVLLHALHRHDDGAHSKRAAGPLSVLALVAHSVIDGIGIGLAFQLSPALGVTVALAVIAHDFCDGLNTVGLMLMHGRPATRALAMLALDALAPLLGVLFARAWPLPPQAMLPGLGFLAGLLLYIGAADILPQARSRAGPAATASLLGLTALGLLVVFAAASLAR